LIVTDEGGVSSPVQTRHQDELLNTQSTKDTNNTDERLSYAYAGDEFRPLIITDNGGIAAPLQRKQSEQINNLPLVDQRRAAPMRYEEVEIHGGKFDRANLNTTQLRAGNPGGTNIAVENEDDTYEAVDQQDIASSTHQRNEQTTNARQDFTLDSGDQDVGDVYAVVQKDKNRKDRVHTNYKPDEASNKNRVSDIPPKLPSRMDITKSDLCESISGELQNMINACDEGTNGNTNGTTSRSSSREGYSLSVRPPLPKPYSGSGVGVTGENTEVAATTSSDEGKK
jgi:hypothetical protein